ncbi:hypothetical protein OsJ_23869 [Oryza sativa Japonica Group]|nr:hypothetical protein OsJ_23869 [Oryza sativa Japonica Group]BAD31374.1 hypothetical protein [Oryza sativa Japonica Group]
MAATMLQRRNPELSGEIDGRQRRLFMPRRRTTAMVDGATSTGLHVITNIENRAISMWYTRSRVSCELWFVGVAGDFIEQLRAPTGGREDGGISGGWRQSLMGEVRVVKEESGESCGQGLGRFGWVYDISWMGMSRARIHVHGLTAQRPVLATSSRTDGTTRMGESSRLEWLPLCQRWSKGEGFGRGVEDLAGTAR